MKFSIAAIVLGQALPTWSEVPVRAELAKSGHPPRNLQSTVKDSFRAPQEKTLTAAQRRLAFQSTGLKNGPQDLKGNVYCDPTSTDPDTGILSCGDDRVCLDAGFGGICVPKTSASSLVMRSTHGRLFNQGAAAGNPVPCDPTSGDIGILACGQDQVCQVDESSEFGGFCSSTSAASRRLAVDKCNATSPDTLSDCDCAGLDTTTGTGYVQCVLYDNYELTDLDPTCPAIFATVTIGTTYENSVATAVYFCTRIDTVQEEVCVGYTTADDSCALTLNGQPCSACNVNASIYDCTNVGGGEAYVAVYLLPTVASCIPANSTDSGSSGSLAPGAPSEPEGTSAPGAPSEPEGTSAPGAAPETPGGDSGQTQPPSAATTFFTRGGMVMMAAVMMLVATS